MENSMAANWSAGLMRWIPYADEQGKEYPLCHLHPFRMGIQLPSQSNHSQVDVLLHMGFAMHCFTRAKSASDPNSIIYQDDREVRAFCFERYGLSFRLPEIARSLSTRHCQFAKSDNYVVVDNVGLDGVPKKYGVFFNLKKQKSSEVLVIFQSAYAIAADRQPPGKGRIGFNALLGHTLRGTKPKIP
jgi:hypothetical protein